MKNTFIKGVALLAMASFVLFSCSTENDAQTASASEQLHSRLTNRAPEGVYGGFEHLMADLYHDAQIVERAVEYGEGDDLYWVSEVTVDRELQGYFLENQKTKSVVYLSEDATRGTLNYYTLVNGSIDSEVYDLTLDPNYATDGFSTITPRTVAGRRFWGLGAPHLQDGPCIGGVRPMVQTHYVFWIATHDVPVMGAGGLPVTAPCE